MAGAETYRGGADAALAPGSDKLAVAPETVRDPIRRAFALRTMGAINRIMHEASTEALTEALAAPTDVGALALVLGNSGVVGAAVVELDPTSVLVARNAGHRLDLLRAADGTLSASEVGSLLGISRQAVDKRRRARSLLALREGGDWHYPRCQFDERSHEPVPGLREVIAGLAEQGPWATLDFLLAPDTVLDGLSPFDALRRGGPWQDRVRRLIRVQQGDGFA